MWKVRFFTLSNFSLFTLHFAGRQTPPGIYRESVTGISCVYPMFGYLNTHAVAKAGAALYKVTQFVSENFIAIFVIYILIFGVILTYKSALILEKVLQKIK